MTGGLLELMREQILAFRRRVGSLDPDLSKSGKLLEPGEDRR